MIKKLSTIEYEYNDGGQTTVGIEPVTGDCVIRAIAIATGIPYREVYDNLYRVSLEYAADYDNRTARAMRRAMKDGGPHWRFEVGRALSSIRGANKADS